MTKNITPKKVRILATDGYNDLPVTQTAVRDMIAAARANGGFSYSPRHGFATDRGYFASVEGMELQVPANVSDENLERALTGYVFDNAKEFSECPNAYIGGWIAPDKVGVGIDVLYLDLSIRFSNERACRTFARRNNQLAYYDAANAKSVTL